MPVMINDGLEELANGMYENPKLSKKKLHTKMNKEGHTVGYQQFVRNSRRPDVLERIEELKNKVIDEAIIGAADRLKLLTKLLKKEEAKNSPDIDAIVKLTLAIDKIDDRSVGRGEKDGEVEQIVIIKLPDNGRNKI